MDFSKFRLYEFFENFNGDFDMIIKNLNSFGTPSKELQTFTLKIDKWDSFVDFMNKNKFSWSSGKRISQRDHFDLFKNKTMIYIIPYENKTIMYSNTDKGFTKIKKI